MQWYLNRSGRPEGPYEEAQIIQMVIEGFVPWNAMVGAQGASAWIPIIEHPPFADAMSRTSQAGLPTDLVARAAAGRPPSGGTYPSLDGHGSPFSAGMPISDIRLGLPKLSTKQLLAIAGGFTIVVAIISFSISRIRGGFARVLDEVGSGLVRYGVVGEPVEDEWPNVPLHSGGANVHATDHTSVTTQLVGLGAEPEPRFMTLHMRLCGASSSVELDAYVLDGDVRVGGLVPHPGDACDSIKRNASGGLVTSAAEAADRRVRILGERGVALWNAMHDPDCDVPLVRAGDLADEGIAEPLATEFTAADTDATLRAACAVVASDTGTRAPFVELGTVGVVLSGENDTLGVISSRIERTDSATETFTLSAIESRRIGQ